MLLPRIDPRAISFQLQRERLEKLPDQSNLFIRAVETRGLSLLSSLALCSYGRVARIDGWTCGVSVVRSLQPGRTGQQRETCLSFLLLEHHEQRAHQRERASLFQPFLRDSILRLLLPSSCPSSSRSSSHSINRSVFLDAATRSKNLLASIVPIQSIPGRWQRELANLRVLRKTIESTRDGYRVAGVQIDF